MSDSELGIDEESQIQLDTKLIFTENINLVLDFNKIEFSHFLDSCENWATVNAAKSSKVKVTKQALANARGKWYEWLITLGYWNWVESQTNVTFILAQLPNVSSFDSTNLFQSDERNLISIFKDKLSTKDVTLITSNPDFVLIKGLPNKYKLMNDLTEVDVDLNILDLMSNFYTNFIGSCRIDDIIGYLAVKSSMRPDRRLQIAHEGSVFKALSRNISISLKNKEYIPGFFAFTTKTTDKDQRALKTAATHSIADNASHPIRAVDLVFDVNNFSELSTAFSKIQTTLL